MASGKRELIEPTPGDKRYVRRDEDGRFTESDDVSRSLSQDVRKKAKGEAAPGQGDRGDRKRDPDCEEQDVQDARVDDVSRGPDDEEVPEALVEDDLGGHPGVGAPEEDGEGTLPSGEHAAAVDVLVGVLRRLRHEACVACGELGPGLRR